MCFARRRYITVNFSVNILVGNRKCKIQHSITASLLKFRDIHRSVEFILLFTSMIFKNNSMILFYIVSNRRIQPTPYSTYLHNRWDLKITDEMCEYPLFVFYLQNSTWLLVRFFRKVRSVVLATNVRVWSNIWVWTRREDGRLVAGGVLWFLPTPMRERDVCTSTWLPKNYRRDAFSWPCK